MLTKHLIILFYIYIIDSLLRLSHQTGRSVTVKEIRHAYSPIVILDDQQIGQFKIVYLFYFSTNALNLWSRLKTSDWINVRTILQYFCWTLTLDGHNAIRSPSIVWNQVIKMRYPPEDSWWTHFIHPTAYYSIYMLCSVELVVPIYYESATYCACC